MTNSIFSRFQKIILDLRNDNQRLLDENARLFAELKQLKSLIKKSGILNK